MKEKKILVVMGGTSSEREVSLRSGTAIYDSLKHMGYNAYPFVLDDKNAMDIISEKPDLCVLALHGKKGEDGAIQGMLEMMDIPYTGSGIASSAVCMDKILTKKLVLSEKIPTPQFAVIRKGADVAAVAEDMESRCAYPLVVKAPRQGSSVGVEIVDNKQDLIASVENNIGYDGEILVEEFIKGTELTVPVLQVNGELICFPIIEIVSENKFYDFESKYTAGMSHHLIPARISEQSAKRIEQYARLAYGALNCKGVVRIDFFLDKAENPYLIEVNTIPGMTATSLVPDSAKAAGMSFGELVEKMIISALEK